MPRQRPQRLRARLSSANSEPAPREFEAAAARRPRFFAAQQKVLERAAEEVGTTLR